MKTNENGRSMVEMLGVLAIIGVLSAGGLAGYSKAMFKHKLNNTMDQITMLVTNIRTMYGAQGNYGGLDDDLINLGIVPAVMGSSPSKLTNPFKGKVEIKAIDLGQVTNGGFTVKYSGLPQEACIALATADFGSGAGSGFIGAMITDADAASGTYGATTEGSAYGMGGANDDKGALDYCTSDDSEITWTFY